MIKKFFAITFTFLCATTFAQTVTVKKTNERVKSESVEGYSNELDGKFTDVNSQWNKFLKNIGKIKFLSSEPVVVTAPNFNGTVYPNGILYAHIFDNGNTTRVWLGIQPKEWADRDVDNVNKQLEKLAYQFGIQFYRSKVQTQIDETQQATDAVEKQRQRLFNQNKNLTTQLINNEQGKTRLEKALIVNGQEHETLKTKLELNKKAQDSIANAAVQIKRVMDAHQEKLNKIN